MKIWNYYLIVILSISCFLDAYMIHQNEITREWERENLDAFDEMIMSWNAIRPDSGRYLFYASVKTEEWSPSLLYASWGSEGQQSFLNKSDFVRIYQDAIEILDGRKATGFRIKIITEGNASLDQIYHLHVYTNSDKELSPKKTVKCKSFISLDVPGISQMTLSHIRNVDLCSPTSTTAVIRYLGNNHNIDPLIFAFQAWDSGFDIFGNWVFNIAQASAELGRLWNCWVERLCSFDDIYLKLQQEIPVIVSLRGPLPGSALPYAKGHLMAVVGYDPGRQKVICMDPAFPSHKETRVEYAFSEFVDAWSRRGNVAYIFNSSITSTLKKG